MTVILSPSAVVPTDIAAPGALLFPILQGTSGLDLTTATGASLSVQKPDGTTVVWTGTIVAITLVNGNYVQGGSLTAGACGILYVFGAGGTDCAVAGTYTVHAVLTVPSGTATIYPPQQFRAAGIFQA